MSRLIGRTCLFIFSVLLAACAVVPSGGLKDTSKTFNTVVVDAGHGGKDTGAYRRYGGAEKYATLDVARVWDHPSLKPVRPVRRLGLVWKSEAFIVTTI